MEKTDAGGLLLGKPVIFYDGVCGLCNAAVDWIIARDPHAKFLFAPLQGRLASVRLELRDREELASIVLLTADGLYRRSDAAREILRVLGGRWKFAALLLGVVPRPMRDLVYNFVAKVRYRFFGQRETCRIPSASERARFLD